MSHHRSAIPQIKAINLTKTFTLHHQGGVVIEAVQRCSFDVAAGEAVVLTGPSGSGKSSVLRCLYGNYGPDAGQVLLQHRGTQIDLATAPPALVLDARRYSIGWVSQFLRVIPRVPTIDLVAEPAVKAGLTASQAGDKARILLRRLNIPERLWNLAPATFSGGEQQRVNVARGLAGNQQVLLVDEPTASLDEVNSAVVVELLADAVAHGAAIVGIFHDASVRDAIATRLIDVTHSQAGAQG
jgi:alpha-D-ribose 1-methylphosphonate 5-triphosphate synthase subunit PhnL